MPPGPPVLLSKNERVHIAHQLRAIDDVMLGAARAYSPTSGMAFITRAQHNAQIDDLIDKLQKLKKET